MPTSEVSLTAPAPTLLRTAVLVTVLAGVIRIVLAAFVPLFPDEMYYWEWSRSLRAGYFDHPPGIALFIAGGTTLLGDTVLGVRLLSVLGGTVAAFALMLLARRLGGDRAALHAAIILACLPLAATGLVLATPDAPLLAFGALGLVALDRALTRAPRSAQSLRWWMLAGVALGAAFVSKYTAVLLPMGVVLAVLFDRELRPRLAEPGPYVAAIIALLMFAPVIWWNATHEWVSFRFQLGHGLGSVPARGSAPGRVLELLGGQLALATPILFALMVAAVSRACMGRMGDVRQRLLAVVATTVLLFFALSALRKPVEANWPAATYLAAVPLLAVAAAMGRWPRWLTAGYLIGGALVFISWVHSLVPVLPVSARRDPVARAHGWDALAAATNRFAMEASAGGRRPHIAADRYQDASALAFHLPGQPYIPALNLGGRPNQYDLWPGFGAAARTGDDLVYVLGETNDVHPAAERLRSYFSAVERGPAVELRRGSEVVTRRRIWLLRDWNGAWPD